MKKTLLFFTKSFLLLCLVGVTFNIQAQVVFQEDFDGISGNTEGGAGTYAFPSGWSLFNVDGHTPESQVDFVNDAWIRLEGSITKPDTCAISTSYYGPAGKSDDWMFTPAIGPLPANCVLKWKADVYDTDFPDGYEVRIMAVAPTSENILTSTILYTQVAENDTWTERQVSLAAYAGMTVHIAFRNTSNDMFLLAIDDISVEIQPNIDAKLKSSGGISEYTMIPAQQVVAPFILQDTIINAGALPLTNVQLQVNVYDESDNQIYTASSPAVPSMVSGAKQYFTVGSWTPETPGQYYFKYFPVIAETDEKPSNDTLTAELIITDTTYARDNSTIVGNLGIGAGTGGYIGQTFTIVNQTDLRSVSYYVNRGYTGEKTACAIWNMSAGLPGEIIAVTDTILYPDDLDHFFTLPVSGGPITLAPGDYLVSVIEFDSTIALAQSAEVFTKGTVWVSWPTQAWANVEDFGSSYTKSFVIRPNLYTCSEIAATGSIIGSTCSTCPDGSISVVPSGGVDSYIYLWNTTETTPDISGLLPGSYTLKITDEMNCSTQSTYEVLNTVGIEETSKSDFTVTPNPNNGKFIISSVSELAGDVTIDIFNLTGEKVYSSKQESSIIIKDTIDLSGIAPGLYVIRFSSAIYTKFAKVIIK